MAETETLEKTLSGVELAKLLVETILEKKGSDILLLDVTDQVIFADHFLLCSAENKRQVKAIADALWLEAKHLGGRIPNSHEGDAEGGWIVLDFGELIVHIFAANVRSYYDLETLWSEAYRVLRLQ